MKKQLVVGITAALLGCSSGAFAGSGSTEGLIETNDGGLTSTPEASWNSCGSIDGGAPTAGPQAPRDIDKKRGTNTTLFKTAPKAKNMNLCNIHYHWNAEHKSAAYSIPVDTNEGAAVKTSTHDGWAIVTPISVDPEVRAAADIRHLLEHPEEAHDIGIIVGDTIEVHWVHTTCDVDDAALDPVNGLGNCLTAVCGNPQLRVMTQVFEVVAHGADFETMEEVMMHEGKRVVYTGSTTGPSYNNDHCSPYQVTWDVNKATATIDAHALAHWSHEMGEHAHGVRELVTRPELLSRIKGKGKKKGHRNHKH